MATGEKRSPFLKQTAILWITVYTLFMSISTAFPASALAADVSTESRWSVQSEDSTNGEPARSAPNAVYLELWGNNFGYSINYDRRLFGTNLPRKEGPYPISVTLRVGADFPRFLALPLMVNLLFGSEHHIEFGYGVIFMPLHYFPYSGGALGGREESIYTTATIGYRYQDPRTPGFVFRLSLTPVFVQQRLFENRTLPFVLSLGASLGYGF